MSAEGFMPYQQRPPDQWSYMGVSEAAAAAATSAAATDQQVLSEAMSKMLLLPAVVGMHVSTHIQQTLPQIYTLRRSAPATSSRCCAERRGLHTCV
jgi:hypothetical protein